MPLVLQHFLLFSDCDVETIMRMGTAEDLITGDCVFFSGGKDVMLLCSFRIQIGPLISYNCMNAEGF